MSGATFSTLIFVLGVFPQPAGIQDHFDLIEVNHYYDSRGQLIFDQMIFYEWSQKDARFNVAAWRLMKSPWQVPRKRWTDEVYTVTWRDGDVIRSITATNVRETWTQYDPELIERGYLPREHRRGLTDHICNPIKPPPI